MIRLTRPMLADWCVLAVAFGAAPVTQAWLVGVALPEVVMADELDVEL